MIFRIAAIVTFILAFVFSCFVEDITHATDLGLVALGLALWCASAFDLKLP